jgi:hypothetical protein
MCLFLIAHPCLGYITLVGNRDGRTQSARVRCCCIWLSGPGFQDLDTWLSGPGFQDLDKRALGFTLRTWVSGPRQTATGFHDQDLGFRTSKALHPTVVLSFSRHFSASTVTFLFPVTFLCVHRHFSLRPVVTDGRTHGRTQQVTLYISYYTASILFCVDEKWFISILHPCLSYITYYIASILFCVDEKWYIFILRVDDKWSSSTC